MHVLETCLKESGKDRFSLSGIAMARAAEAIDMAAKRCIEGRDVTEADRRYMAALADAPEGEAKNLLPEFADLCDRLAAIAQKQLSGETLDAQDFYLIDDYGAALAKFHFYDGNAYLGPRDDFPMTSPVFVSPEGNQAAALHAAVARPEAIYVIVANGEQVALHLGAVLSYREFQRPIDEPMDDDVWLEEIDAGSTPPPPSWTSSFRRSITEQEIVTRIRAGFLDPNAAMTPSRKITLAMIEMLPRIEPDDFRAWCESIPYRATNEDIPAIFHAMTQVQPEKVAVLAGCLLRMEYSDWRQHGGTLLSFLSHESLPVADSAAWLMGAHPETIDVAALAEAYTKQSLRTRRLYLYVIGRHPEPGEIGERLLLKALADPHPAIRYQAAIAVSTGAVGGAEIVAQLLKGMDDPNEYTAAAMVRALALLGEKEAAPQMLERLKGDWFSIDDESPEGQAQRADLTEGMELAENEKPIALACYAPSSTYFGGWDSRSRVDGPVRSLAEELIAGLGNLQYRPAREELLQFVHLPSSEEKRQGLGPEAIDALLDLEPERQGQLLLEIIRQDNTAPDALERALRTRDALRALGRSQLRELALEALRELFLEAVRERKANRAIFMHALAAMDGLSDPALIETLLPLTDLPDRPDVYSVIIELLQHVDTTAPAGAEQFRDVKARFRQHMYGRNRDAAREALFGIDPDTILQMAMTEAMDGNASRESRSDALKWLHKAQDASYVEKLLPLLQDEAPSRYEGRHLCEDAATTIASICLMLDPTIAEHTRAIELARDGLRKMLTGPYGDAAVESLLTLEGMAPRKADLFLQIASIRSFSHAARARAVEVVTRFNDRSYAKRIASLLDDKTRLQEDGLSIGDHAANAIADLLGKEDWVTDSTSIADREAFRQKARAWAEAE